MAKAKNVYVCNDCGADSPRWMGKCPACGAWNTMTEMRLGTAKQGKARSSGPVPKAVRVADVRADDSARTPTGIGELDRALGGGLVPGGVVLLGGDPGIGKSTLTMQAVAALASAGKSTLYVTAEESAAQVAMRARRLAGDGMDDVRILATTELEAVEQELASARPDVCVLDSVQTLRSGDLESASGTVSQLREVSSRMTDIAKRDGISMFIIGHVTKEGALAGPKVLEHLVDTVLYFEGDRSHAFRLLRVTKNRYGSASEVGVFEMLEEGLREVPDPSALFLAERAENAYGSIVVPSAEGSRPLCVEIQALVAPAVYGAARRVTSGVDSNRIAILLAVIERRMEMHVLDRDVFVSVAGGVKLAERATDVAVVLAIVSSLRQQALPQDLAAFGEVGLSGEVRAVARPGLRVQEAVKLGYKRIVMPASNADRLNKKERAGATIISVKTLDEAVEASF